MKVVLLALAVAITAVELSPINTSNPVVKILLGAAAIVCVILS